jgi:hypothetical protein
MGARSCTTNQNVAEQYRTCGNLRAGTHSPPPRSHVNTGHNTAVQAITEFTKDMKKILPNIRRSFSTENVLFSHKTSKLQLINPDTGCKPICLQDKQ